MLFFAAAALGLILGSFLNALSFRWGTGRSVMRGRSRCMHCGHALGAQDLVPVFSFLFLRGRCRHCGARMSLQYPAVEAGGLLVSVAVYIAHPEPLAFFFWLLVWMILLFIVVYDLRHMIIPTSPLALLAALALMQALLFSSYWTIVAGVMLAFPLFFISLMSDGRWMGWSDGALELALGWMLGFTAGLTALLSAFCAGALVGIGMLIASKRFTMKSELPLAPFLILGAALAHFAHVDLFQTLFLILP